MLLKVIASTLMIGFMTAIGLGIACTNSPDFEKNLKNVLGKTLTDKGYCPNCGDSYSWKAHPPQIKRDSMPVNIVFCGECTTSKRFNYEKIKMYGYANHWDPTCLERELRALQQYQTLQGQ